MSIRKMGAPLALVGVIAGSIHEATHTAEVSSALTLDTLAELSAIVKHSVDALPAHGSEPETNPAQTVTAVEMLVSATSS